MTIDPRDPLHGVTLQKIVTELSATYGWKAMAERVPVRCFMFNPTINSSLRFLRKTPWARKKIEQWYADDVLAKSPIAHRATGPSLDVPEEGLEPPTHGL